jgi:hypothetical protein
MEAATGAAPVAADTKDVLNRLLCLLINVVELDDGTRCASPADRPCRLLLQATACFRPKSRQARRLCGWREVTVGWAWTGMGVAAGPWWGASR